jgi:hypothetical protein
MHLSRAWLGVRLSGRHFPMPAIAVVLVLLALADGGPTRHAYPIECTHEPELPPMLSVEPDPLDPDVVRVRVFAGLDATARLEVDSRQPVAWEKAPSQARLQLRRGDAERNYALRVATPDPSLASANPRRVRVGLVIEDADGHPSLTVHKEVDLDPAIGLSSAPVSREIFGASAWGDPVLARVPADAPAPIFASTGEAAP